MNALWAKKRSQQLRMVWMEKNSKKYFSAKHCFLCGKPLWEYIARTNIFPTSGIDWVMMFLNQSCTEFKAPKQKSSPSPLTFCVYHRLWILLNLCPPCLNPSFIVFIEWNSCQYHLPLKMFSVSGLLKSLFVMFCMGYCKCFC